MGAIDQRHAGLASGINNAVARVAGLVAIAVFGVVLVRAFDHRVRPRLDDLELTQSAQIAVEGQLSKLAGAELTAVPLDATRRAAVRRAIDESFVAAFRLVMIAAAALAGGASVCGALIKRSGQEVRSAP
jgi:hypothetical protein